MAHISHLRHLSLPVLFFIYINIVFADPRAIHIFRRDDSTGVSSTATDASTSQPGTSSQPTTTEADPTSQPVIFTSTTSSSISDSSTSTSSLTSSSISAVISNINGATPTNTINSDIYNATLTPNKLPLTPEITPGSAVAGVILLLTGIVYTLIGIKNKWLHISLSAAYLSSLAVTVLIVYVMNPPVSHAVQGAYVVAIVLTGCILGAASLAFTEMTEGLGCILGGFSLSMWLLVLKPGGLVTSTSGKAALISTLTFAVFATSFTHYSRPYGLIVSLSFGGATVIILGIDCFSRAGLKEFWAYIWNLNDNLFPVGATTYPMTKGIKVEIAAIVILFLAGIVSQMKLWKVIKENRERRASERLEDERTMQQEEENVGNRIERHNARERSQWEAVYGDKDRLKASINSNRDSGVTDLDSQKKGPTSTITSVRRSREDGIEMSEIPSPTVPTAAGLIIPNSQQDGLKVTIQVGRDLEPPKDVQGQSADRLSQISQKSLQQDESVWVVGEDSEARLERRPLQNNSKRASCNSKAPDVVPLPFKIPDEDGEDGQSSVATFADEDHPGSKRNSRHISSGSNFLQKLSKISYKDSKRFSKDEGVSTEDLVLPQANDDDRASSIAATMDGLSDDEDVKSVQSSLGLNREVNEGRADGQSEQRELKDKETVPAEEPIVPTVEDQTRPVIKPSLTSSTDPTPAVIEKESQNDDSNTTGKPNQTTSIASILDSGTSTSITTQRLPPPPPRVVTSYRTNEWAKHLSSAETPDIEELKIDSPMESTSVEAVAPVNVDALQETPENNLLPPASISVSHISNYPPRASTLQSKISQRSSSINIDATTACSSSQQSPQRQPSQQSINTRSAAFRSSSHFFPPAIAESPIEEDQVPASFNAYNANKINTFGPTSTLMGKRDTMLRTKPSFQNNSSVLPPTAEAVDVSRSVSDSGSIYNLPDDDNMSLAARRNLIRQSSLQTNSLQPGPVAFDSHQPKRQSSAPHPLERESKLASFRANVQEELKSSIQPRKSIERQRSALLLGRQAEEQRRAFNAMMKGSRDNEFTERMRRGDIYSMPVTRSRNGMHEMLSLDQTNTARFLFGEDEGATSPDVNNYLQMNATDDNFPILVRREDYPGLLSASSAALDLALSQSPAPDAASNGWSNTFARHRPSQHSLPMNSLPNQAQANGTASASQSNPSDSPISVRPAYRHSLDLKFFDGPQETSPQVASPPKHVQATPPKLQSSYSANDVPTMRTASNGISSVNTTPNSHAQQHLHNHNASLGRIPPSAMNNRLSREITSSDNSALRESQSGGYQSIQSALQASAAPFGPSLTQGMSQGQVSPTLGSPAAQQPFSVPGYYGNNYNMQMMTMGMQNMQMGQPMFTPHNPYANYGGVYPQQNGTRDSQARVIQQRRQNDGEAMNRFANMALEQLGGEIYALCKDQHGCRYLQKKLEDRNPEQVHMIWLETNQHVIELMTDPFGNYLCQKLLEFCNDDERTVLIENASHDLVRIALNQHGTRALQKMIEFISTPGQIQTIIGALRYRVVELIQDLNGNHVIQKCLNKLSPTDAQFIFDAVGTHCVDVGTHRHGCCVLQRCIDHASGDQKAWLIRQISNNAYVLVQDPFGNYVVQYILDLNEPVFTEPLVAMFQGRVGQLSKQKFSSNVIEKCLRCAQEPSKDMLIEEMLQPSELDRLLRDSFANYVIQTALDYANPAMKMRLVEAIRPYLPAIRTTPYGRRIQAKIQGNEGRSGSSSGQATPNEGEPGQQTATRHHRGLSNASAGGIVSPVSAFSNGYSPVAALNGLPATTRPTPQTGSFPASDRLSSAAAPQSAYPYPYGRSGGQSGAGNWL
ncbi:hypothetical protein B7494_g6502 [Chlorociboria aeruginascens]|nr:hypothetical protein B7494_g6502 [Chlorociboria aeruginascens]